MIDMHSHILPGIDDGASSIEESIEMLRKMAQLGYQGVVLTPHYITGSSFQCNHAKKIALARTLQKRIEEENIPIRIFLGNEIYIDSQILSLLEKKEVAPINQSRYLLIELPRDGKINDLDSLIFTLRTHDKIPIIAHPERYVCLQENVSLIDELVSHGALLQVNFESLQGKYGKQEQKLAIYLFKKKKMHFLGSDLHHQNSQFFERFPKLKKEIIGYLGEEKFREVTFLNPLRVLKDEYINTEV